MKSYEMRKQARIARGQSRWERRDAKWYTRHARKPLILRTHEIEKPKEIVIIPAKLMERPEKVKPEPEPESGKEPEAAEKRVEVRKPTHKKVKRTGMLRAVKKPRK